MCFIFQSRNKGRGTAYCVYLPSPQIFMVVLDLRTQGMQEVPAQSLLLPHHPSIIIDTQPFSLEAHSSSRTRARAGAGVIIIHFL
jgi:hypothetical protein